MKAMAVAFSIKIFVFFSLLVITAPVFGQEGCLTDEETKSVINLLNTTQKVSENKALRRELLSMQQSYEELQQKISDNWQENQKLIPSFNELGEKNLRRVCEIVKQHGWVRKELVGEDGAAAALFLIRANKAFTLQREIFPVIVAAVEKGLVGKHELAWLIDSIRVGSGQPQIFGTQTRVRDEIFYLYPLQSEERVDEWRKMYNLAPLESYIKNLQAQYQVVVLKTPRPPATAAQKKESPQLPTSTASPADQLLDLEKDEVVKVESRLVNLNVRISVDAPNADLDFQKSDFVVYEDGVLQEIEFFSTTETPFDLVLLLDLSGSTAGKINLIRQSTQRFIEAARPSDRIAIVPFSYDAEIVAGLTQNRQELLASVKNIRGNGGSGIWAAIEFALEKIIKSESQRRRSAIVIMTDGVDSSLISRSIPPYYPTFMELLETVRMGDTTIIPIYLDTETRSDTWMRKAYRTARRTLSMIAEESGGQVYEAKRIEDLNGVYEKVIKDLGKVYSLGYQSSNEVRDGGWRKITVTLPNHPNISVRTRPGYYAK
jgi:VWFA-related protein